MMSQTEKSNSLSSRRQFVKGAAVLAGAAMIVPRHVLGGPKFTPPSEKVNIAIIGAGGQGRHNARALFREESAQVVAVADPMEWVSVEQFYYKGKAGSGPVKQEVEKHYSEKNPNFKCAVYEDFRVMLDKEKSVDAILCATPDHLHAYVSVWAMRMGKHVYCEKPLTHNIWEARKVARTARETGVATQMGNFGHSSEGIRSSIEYLRDGAIGNVTEVHGWAPASRWNTKLKGLPEEKMDIPAGLNWDLWLGPREPRPYHSCYVPVMWRDFWTFGCGVLGDFACHDLDATVWAFDLEAPEIVEGYRAGYGDSEIQPYGDITYFQFGKRKKQKPLKVTWYSGGLRPPRPEELKPGMNLDPHNVMFKGDKGIILTDGWGGPPKLFPDKRRASYTPPKKTIPRVEGHHRDWLDACKGGKPASGEFQYSARLTEIVLLGVLALRSGKRIEWDYDNLQAKGMPELDVLIQEPYRKGWELD
ncbi:MAG: Gfo/Idh/MocA family oxidoreductase [Candidatus Sumerlaeota bacterium]|nr:Gfo/Idh/MocA family oxidoreductase [Candidatus Sumerlaeota bacterium]